jgi:DNA-binding MarR family transcriptional regulator
MANVRWLSEREERAWRTLQLMQLRLEGELARQLASDSGLSYPDYLVLAALTAHEDRMRVFELATVLGWEKSRLSHHLGRMVDRDLVAKEPCPDDRRGAFIVVTTHGRREIESAAPGHVEAVRRLFVDLLEPGQLDVIGDVAETVLEALAPE